ncbi:hypothetical protein L596_023176 [Steinernema carpocapsae]|uniref:G-protein coupled receptors family 1 profile domain-containing protein n=1 Tax=Steinernema carpocapsae TaxID=34508 RepID=A0A4U5MCW0_STECR|nr:hypothetical protein L596_023176 [Steinernema carpocapsae]
MLFDRIIKSRRLRLATIGFIGLILFFEFLTIIFILFLKHDRDFPSCNVPLFALGFYMTTMFAACIPFTVFMAWLIEGYVTLSNAPLAVRFQNGPP